MTVARHSRRWMLFFAVLGLLALTALLLENWYNLAQQLTSARLEAARVQWRQQSPASYDVRYTIKRQARGGERLLARVRDGEVTVIEAAGEALDPALYPYYDVPGLLGEVERVRTENPALRDGEVDWTSKTNVSLPYAVAVRGGQVVRAESDGQALPPSLRRWYDMPALLDGIGRFLEQDARAGGWRMYNVASFDPSDGRVLHYVRSSMQTRERIEFILTRFDLVAESGSTP
jgi:hypothetical protein